MTKFKNVFLLAAMAVSAVAFTGCEKDDEGTDNQTNAWLTATNVEGVPGDVAVDSVKVLIGDYVAGRGKYENGGFTLSSLSSVPNNYLVPVEEQIGQLSDVTANPADANGSSLSGDFYVYAYKDGNQVGKFEYLDYDSDTYTEKMNFQILYVDKDVEITGSYEQPVTKWTVKLNLSPKRGWNKVYGISTRSDANNTIEFTTTEPSGMNPKWYFRESWYK